MERLYEAGKSSCCKKGLLIVSDDEEGTCYYKCQACGEACDDRNWEEK